MPRDSSPAAPRAPAPDFDRLSLSPEIVARLIAGWRALCEDERDSVIAATLVAGDLARLGAPPSILAAAARVIEDEIRHVGVCATVLERLGAEVAEVPAEERRRGVGDDLSNRAPDGAGAGGRLRRRRIDVSGLFRGGPSGLPATAGSLGPDRASPRRGSTWSVRNRDRTLAHEKLVGRRTSRAVGRMRRGDGGVRATPRRSGRKGRGVDTGSRRAGRRHPEPTRKLRRCRPRRRTLGHPLARASRRGSYVLSLRGSTTSRSSHPCRFAVSSHQGCWAVPSNVSDVLYFSHSPAEATGAVRASSAWISVPAIGFNR